MAQSINARKFQFTSAFLSPIVSTAPTTYQIHHCNNNTRPSTKQKVMQYTQRCGKGPKTIPAKTNLQDHARFILHARLAWHVHAICPFSCMILAQSCTYLARNGARFCKNCCKNNYLHFLHIFCNILQELVQDCARKGTYRVHVTSKSCMQDSCKILA